MSRKFILLLTILLCLAAFIRPPREAKPAAAEIKMAQDTTDPFPLDRGNQPGTPATYKGLALELTDNGEPQVTPVDGVIGVVCIGMSNANQECADFIEKLDGGLLGGQVNRQVRFVNCAVGNHALERWNDPQYDVTLWDACLTDKIPQRGLRADQIRVVWHKTASQFTTDSTGQVYPPYPHPDSDYFRFYNSLTRFANRLLTKLPSVQAVYTTSRSYGGFSTKPPRGEPLSFEEGLALNQWLADHPAVGPMWHGWGPYIWAPACATNLRNGSNVCYVRTDYQADGIHPTAAGRRKVSRMLHDRFRQHRWYAPTVFLPVILKITA